MFLFVLKQKFKLKNNQNLLQIGSIKKIELIIEKCRRNVS